MGSFSSLVIGVLAVTAASISFAHSRSGILTVLVAIAVVLIGKSVQPFFVMLWGKFLCKFFPLPEVTEFYEKKLYSTETEPGEPPMARGLRVLVMTEFLELGPKTKPLYQDMAETALNALSESSPLFALRLGAVDRRKAPKQYVCALCGKDGENMRKCLSAWMKTDALRNMRSRKKDKDLFLYDGEIDAPGEKESIRYTVMVLFDGNLPVTLPKKAEEGGPAPE